MSAPFAKRDRLTTAELADRLHKSVGTLRAWRVKKMGPPYVQEPTESGRGSNVTYLLKDVIAWERRNKTRGGE